ncbi:hypothetical protein M1L60_22430 [Actinoplanes sp. TRM 88003]|uniref:Excreted virulence factor EspC (Type VII ESX diderm) n=1 Tax=Paractinoplanes aksuensis TaxID=2939490 RepID=A0ABT1DRB0_9ACTN|nr:hypothetical protein [Actinoplanes aksuensis]MCO8273354.1 hypothetical protein [Actinoplanes aksuensis]
MDEVADHLDQAADALSALSRDIPTLAVAPGAFAAFAALAAAGDGASSGSHQQALGAAATHGGSRADAGGASPPSARFEPGAASTSGGVGLAAAAGPGLPGQMGRALHDHWAAVLDARSREASVAGARLAEMARSVRATRRHYAETDEAVERRFTQEL